MKVLTRRNRREQLLAILDACMEHRITTHVMYRTGINYTLLEELLAELTEKGLLMKTVGKKVSYRTTASGFAVLGSWRQVECALGA